MLETTFKSVSIESDKEGNATGKLIIRLSDECEVVARNVDDDGVITFVEGKSTTIRIGISAFLAKIRLAVADDFVAPFNFMLDKASEGKLNPTDALRSRITALSMMLTNASVKIESAYQTLVADDEEHLVCNYDFAELGLVNAQKRIIAMRFAGEIGGITDVKQQLEYARIIYGVEWCELGGGRNPAAIFV